MGGRSRGVVFLRGLQLPGQIEPGLGTITGVTFPGALLREHRLDAAGLAVRKPLWVRELTGACAKAESEADNKNQK